MNALEIDNEIVQQVAFFVTLLKAFTAMGRTDFNLVAENIVLPIFRELYDYSHLQNLNVGKSGNFPAIDLADDVERVAIQVTSTGSLEKVKHTLEEFLKERPDFDPPLAKRYRRLIVYILTEKQRTYSRESIESVLQLRFPRFPFDPSNDIQDFTNVLADIKGKPLETKRAVLDILKEHVGTTLLELASSSRLIKVPEGMRSEYFVGRDELMEVVHTALTDNEPARRVVVLTGMGGIGKTQAALAYVLQHRASYERILWSSAESEAGLLESLKSLTHALLPASRYVKDASDVLAVLSHWMDAPTNTNWLLVIDGADFKGDWTPARLRARLPETKTGKLLITSQYQDFSAFRGAKLITVEPLTPSTAIEFMEEFAQRDAGCERERDSLAEIARILGCLPIALEQAAAYIRSTGLSFEKYVTLLKAELPVLRAKFDGATDYHGSAQTVCRLALDAVTNWSPKARLLLEFVAFLSAEADCLLPLAMLAFAPDSPLSDGPSHDRDPNRVTLELLELIGSLRAYSLLSQDREKATVRVHSIVQRAAREAMTEEVRRTRLGIWHAALDPFSCSMSNPDHWISSEQWLSHAQSAAESIKPGSKIHIGATAKPPMWWVGYNLLGHAVAVCEYSRQLRIATLQHVRLLTAVGSWLQILGQLLEAAQYFEEALALFDKFSAFSRIAPNDEAFGIIGEIHENLATLNRTRASGGGENTPEYLAKALGHLKQAEAIYTQINDVASDSAVYGPCGLRTANAIQCQGCTYLHAKPQDITQAEILLRRSWEIFGQLKRRGVDLTDSNVTWNQMNLALLERYNNNGLIEAKKKLNAALADCPRGTLDPLGYSMEAILLCHLANLHDDLGEQDEAKQCRERVAKLLSESPMNFDCTLDLPRIRMELNCPLPGVQGEGP
jgi:tetratricopeptide (TPR) repeat protein